MVVKTPVIVIVLPVLFVTAGSGDRVAVLVGARVDRGNGVGVKVASGERAHALSSPNVVRSIIRTRIPRKGS